MSIIRTNILLLAIIAFLPACFKRSIYVKKNAYADFTAIPHGFKPHSSFAITPCEESNDLSAKEVERKISLALQSKGFSLKHLNEANYCLMYKYGMTSDTRLVNNLQYIPGPSITTTGTVSGNYGYARYNETTQASGTFISIPEQRTYYTKHLHCYVYDIKGSMYMIVRKKDETPIWRGDALCVDTYGDLRSDIDFLILDLFDSFGKNTIGHAYTNWYEDNERIELFRTHCLNPDPTSRRNI